MILCIRKVKGIYEGLRAIQWYRVVKKLWLKRVFMTTSTRQFFHNEENLDKLIKFLSLEEVKGRDRFNVKRWILFKGLFRNYGPGMLAPFVPHLERLVKSREESLQRCATGAVTNSDMF